MSSLTVRLAEAGVEQSLSRNTVDCYQHWCRKLWLFSKLPASQWSGEVVRRWLLHLADERYSPVSRKQALCAVKYLLGHEHLDTTMIYLHGEAARGFSPMDALAPSSSAHMLLPVA